MSKPNKTKNQHKMEFTLNLGDRIYIEGYGFIELLYRSHFLAAPAQIARLGLDIQKTIGIVRGELDKPRHRYTKYPLLPSSSGNQ